ncbi:MAG: hypothetical protein FOGNACKC_02643 [Anaerolineae bacterium]|nr:hypothetical protein [Anaerolineae bacterium]
MTQQLMNYAFRPFRRARRTQWEKPRSLVMLIAILFSMVAPAMPAGVLPGHTALAAGGDFSIDFAAAAPFTYNHATGGGAYNDGTIGKANDVVESLEGGDFACGDTVTYFTAITVGGDGDDDPQTIEIKLSFLANTTGQPGAAHASVTNVAVNYGSVENGGGGGLGTFGADTGIVDDGGSTATLISQTFSPPGSTVFGTPPNDADRLTLTFKVDDLEDGETVIVRIDTALTCDPGSNPTGNLQGDLVSARVISPVVDTINAGNQTIPFKQIGDLAGAGEPLLVVNKTLAGADNVCFTQDDVDSMTVTAGDTVKYCYVVSNPGTADLFDVKVVDDNGTSGSSADDFTVALSGLTNIDGQGDLGDLASGASATGEAQVTLSIGGTVVNVATASGNNGLSGGNYAVLTDADTATVIVEGQPNRPPVAADDSATTPEDTPVSINVAANDSDPDDNLDASSASVVSGPANGSLINNGDGTFSYTPNADFNGSDSFVYEICDLDGLCDQATVTITVTPVNDPPVANNDSATTPEGTPVTVNAAANDTDVDNNLDPTSATVLTSPANGTVTNNGDGTFTYTPTDPEFSGTDSFTYKICDTDGLCDEATINITVTPVNDPPVADDDSATTDENTAVDINAAANDSDVDGNLDPTTATVISGPANGTVTNNGDGTFTYEPATNFNGSDSFDYQICDTDGLCDTATVTITVVAVPDPPVANDDSASTPEDTAVTVNAAANDSDLDGDLVPSSASAVSDPANGTVVNNGDGTFTYTPNENFNGSDSFDYQICDATDLCATATVTINVIAVNDPPVAEDDSATTDEDSPVTINAAANDSDVDGNLDPSSASVVSGQTNGSVTNNGDGTFTYTPNENFNGEDSFTYEICDTDDLCDTATVTITVNPVNDPPVAVDDSESTDEDTPVTIDAAANDSDVDGNLDPSSASVVSDPANGTVTNNGDGTFTYTPNQDFSGPSDSFDYQICDTDGLCDTATVTILISAVDDPPAASDDSATTPEDSPVTIPVLDNDSDPDGNLDPSTVSIVNGPAHGEVTINPDGSITYTPAPNFNGEDSFTYEVCDTTGLCDTATVTINVTPVNDAPVAKDDAYSTDEDTTLTVSPPGILVNDSDVDGDSLTVTLLTDPANGTLSQNADGSFSYTPNENFNGVDSYTYEACDPDGLCAEATVTITVNPVNDPPVAEDDSATTDEDTPVTIPASANDSDIDGNLDPSSASVLTGAAHGTVESNGDGTFTYTPDPNYNGSDSFTYEICDTDGLCDTATVNITINPVADPPTANDDSATTPEDSPVTIPVLGNDSDPENNLDPTSVSVVSEPEHGEVTVNPDGTITYTPDPDYNGSDTFTYQVCDTDGLCDTATVTVNVTPVPDPPVANDDSVTLAEDTQATFNVVGNDTDPDGDLDPSTVEVLTPPANGQLVDNGDGSFDYIPNENFNGDDSFTYQVCDETGLCDTATVNITVTPVNDAPVALDDAYLTAQNTTLNVSAADGVLVHGDDDYDIDGDTIFVDSFDATSAFGGTVSVNPDGSFSYTPAQNFAGYDTFTYTISDGNGGFDTATVTIEVTAKNGRSIAVSWGDWTLSQQNLSGSFNIKNMSSGGYNVQLTSYEIQVQYRTSKGGNQWTDVAVTGCTFDPATPTILVDTLSVDFSGCQLASVIPAGATVRVTAVVGIYGHKDKGQLKQFFLSRLSKSM